MPRRSGFTLIEVMVALTVSGIVLLGARAILVATADNATNILASAAAADRDANAERTLRSFFDRLEVGAAVGTEFGGDSATVRFGSWCDVPGGWQERCAVTISLEREGLDNALIARTSLGDATLLRSGIRHGLFRFLTSPNGGGSWIDSWSIGITAPTAVEVIDRDTLVLRIGERG